MSEHGMGEKAADKGLARAHAQNEQAAAHLGRATRSLGGKSAKAGESAAGHAQGKGRETASAESMQKTLGRYTKIVQQELAHDLKEDARQLNQSLKEAQKAIKDPGKALQKAGKDIQATVQSVEKGAEAALKHTEKVGPALEKMAKEQVQKGIKEATKHGTKTAEAWVANATHMAHEGGKQVLTTAVEKGGGKVVEGFKEVANAAKKLEATARAANKVEKEAKTGKKLAEALKPGKLEKVVRRPGERTQLRQGTREAGNVNQLLEKSKDAAATLHIDKVPHLDHAPPGVNQAIDRCKASVHEMANLPSKHWEKTTAGTLRPEGTKHTTVSGHRGSPSRHRMEQGDVNKVREHSQAIGHELTGSGRDAHFHGETVASHAEKQQTVLRPNSPIGVSRPMCKDCVGYMKKEAAFQGKDQYVADPRMARVFKPDQRVIEYHYEGRVVEVANDGRRTELRPPSHK